MTDLDQKPILILSSSFVMLYSVPFMPRIIIDVGAGISSHYQEVCIHPSSESFDGSHIGPY